MTKINKKTVTIGIPAHNEERNIRELLRSILKQKGDNFIIEKIIVTCDGCTDKTADYVKSLQKEFPLIQLIDDGKRMGQAARLSEFYKTVLSDILITFDGDILLAHKKVIYEMVKAFDDKKVGLVGGKKMVVKQSKFLGKSIQAYEHFWLSVIGKLNSGNNVHNHQGPISAGRREFLNRVTIPKHIVASDHFLYFKAIEEGYSFQFAQNAIVYFKVPTTIRDYLSQEMRFTDSAEKIRKYFGKWVLEYYTIPASVKGKSYISTFIRHPFYLSSALVLQVLQRIVGPFYLEKNNNGLWTSIRSSK